MEKSTILSSFLETWVSSGCFPNASLLVNSIEPNQEEFFHCFGSEGSDVRRDSIYRIYSMTKPITSIGIMILVERNLLQLDDEVRKYIPKFNDMRVLVHNDDNTVDNYQTVPLNRHITIRHLLSHTSGISYGLGMDTLRDKILAKLSKNDNLNFYCSIPLRELVNEVVCNAPLAFEPGTSYLYGLNTDVLGYIIEIISGQSLDVFFEEEIFKPLNMIDTGFYVPAEKIHRLVNLYQYDPKSITNKCYKLSANVERSRDKPHTLLSGGGGLVSTIDDYSKLLQYICNNLVDSKFSTTGNVIPIKQSLFHEMVSNQLIEGKTLDTVAFDSSFSETAGSGISFGLGFSILESPTESRGGALSGQGEFGWGGIANTYFSIDIKKGIYMIFMTQLIPSSCFPIRTQLRYLVHKLYGKN